MNKTSNNPEPLILAIETATRAGSVALARGEDSLYSTMGDPAASHSTDLIELVASSLKSAGAELSEVDLFAVALGPGSFTGLRIGLATVKSFAVCTGKRCVGVSTLAAIAHAAGASERTVPLLPAGRGEVFAQSFSVDEGGVRALDDAVHITPEALLEKYGSLPRLIWAGEGAQMQSEVLRAWAEAHQIPFAGLTENSGAAGWSLAGGTGGLAVSIAALALKEYRSGNTVSPDELQAVYVRASDAEINERWQAAKSQPPVLA